LFRELNALPCAVVLPDDGGRIVGWISKFLRLPDEFARHFVERSDGAVVAARRADHHVAIHQDRLRVTPTGRLAAQILHGLAPQHLAVGHASADERALTTERIDTVAVNRRCSAGSVAPPILKNRTDAGGPKF